MRRPVAYVVKQRGLREYTQVVYTKKEAMQTARDILWWSKRVTIQPLYAGRKIAIR
jgi:hypothetical protein